MQNTIEQKIPLEIEPIFKDVEMKVEITNICTTGRCKFCSPLFRPTVEEAGLKKFFDAFQPNLERYLKGGGRRIILTGGGEPIDAPAKLFGTLELIDDAKKKLGVELDLLTIYSNGVGLLKSISPNSAETYLDRLVRYGVRDLNLSVHGLTPEQRTDISGPFMGAIDFDQLIPTMVQKGIRIMTRTTLSKGYIDSVEKVEQFARWMSGLGVGMMYFSDLFTVPVRNEQTTPGSKTVLTWTDEHRIQFDVFIQGMKQSQDFSYVCEFTRHNKQGRTFEFRHLQSGIRVLCGDLAIGNESDEQPTYAYVKPDGSMETHNNAREATKREYVPLAQVKKYRPGRTEPEFQ